MNEGAKSGRRGARPVRREEHAYRAYVSDEQRSPARGPQRGTRVGVGAGCIGGQTGVPHSFPGPKGCGQSSGWEAGVT